jgi:hypothetical protein
MSNLSRRYYERELGAGYGPSPTMKEAFGYSEPLRRFIQRESFEPQANEIANTMPSWLPGDDYMTDFKKGDPFVKVDDGYARLPGKGYEAVHPEIAGINPEDYPDIAKLRILSDVAPYSREYNTFRQKVASEAQHDTQLQIELDKIIDRVRQTKESSIRMADRHFTRSFRPASHKNPRARASAEPLSYLGSAPRLIFFTCPHAPGFAQSPQPCRSHADHVDPMIGCMPVPVFAWLRACQTERSSRVSRSA